MPFQNLPFFFLRKCKNIFFISLLLLYSGLYAQEKPPAVKIGDSAPPLNLEGTLQAPKEFKGSWDDLKGKVVVLEFWATWCAPCRAAITHLNELVNKFKNKPVQFISITNEEEWRVKNFLTIAPISGWIGLDSDSSISKALGIEWIPQTVLVDQGGKIAAIITPDKLDSNLIDYMLAGLAPPIPSKQNILPSAAAEARPKLDSLSEQPLVELSIRPAKPSNSMSFSGGTFKARGMNLTALVSLAFDVSPVRVVASSPPPEEAYEVALRLPDERSSLLRPLLQQALEAAFGLKARWETREMDVLVLNVPENETIKLRESKSAMGVMSDEGVVTSQGTSLKVFAKVLEDALRRVVLDETRLDGLYDLALYWDPKSPESVITAIRRQLGLELRAEKRAIEVLVFETVRSSQKK
jgi:uncharacterized protein (TIGR03435 family)